MHFLILCKKLVSKNFCDIRKDFGDFTFFIICKIFFFFSLKSNCLYYVIINNLINDKIVLVPISLANGEASYKPVLQLICNFLLFNLRCSNFLGFLRFQNLFACFPFFQQVASRFLALPTSFLILRFSFLNFQFSFHNRQLI